MNEPEMPDNTEDAPGAADTSADTSAETGPESGAEAAPDAAAPPAMEAMSESGQTGGRSSAFMGVPIEVLISVGKARPLVSDLVKLRRDSVLSLDTKIDDPVELYVGDKLIARGELQELEDQAGQLGVRLTEVADLSNGV